MKRESVEARLLHLIHHNWTEVAEQILKGGKVKGFANLATGAHVRLSYVKQTAALTSRHRTACYYRGIDTGPAGRFGHAHRA